MPDTKIHILSTRSLDAALISRVAGNNYAVDAIPFIETMPLQTEESATTIQELGLERCIVVFTSMNAVSAVATQLSSVPKWKIFCTGGVTKEYVVKYFGEESIFATARNATNLAHKIVAANNVKKVVFFCGDHRLNDLPETLRQNDIQVQEIVAYTTIQTPVDVEKQYDAILFFSPSAAHSFFSMNTLPTDVMLFSIGNTTTAAIKSYCANRVVTSDWPGTESMLEMVQDFYKEKV